MAVILKSGLSEKIKAEENKKIQSIVEKALADIDSRGDSAVRKMSKDFDKWDPKEFILSAGEIEACIGKLTAQEISDIKFALYL
jgi:sulfopropanediol 3-dehydrogenase